LEMVLSISKIQFLENLKKKYFLKNEKYIQISLSIFPTNF
jgi:hypothetical protein